MYRRTPVYSQIRTLNQLRAERRALEGHLHEIEHRLGSGARRVFNPRTTGTALQVVRLAGTLLPLGLALVRVVRKVSGQSKRRQKQMSAKIKSY